jgi:hypothetical protein
MSSSGSMVAEAMVPRPPALEAAAAISHPVIDAIPPCNKGYLIPNSSVILVLNITAHLSSCKYILSPFLKPLLHIFLITVLQPANILEKSVMFKGCGLSTACP